MASENLGQGLLFERMILGNYTDDDDGKVGKQ